MCSVPNTHRIPLRLAGRKIGTIDIDRTEETKAAVPYRAPMLRTLAGRIVAGKETLVQEGTNGTVQGG